MSRLQYADRMRGCKDRVVRFMNSYYKSIVIYNDIDPIQIHFADNELRNCILWLELNYMDMDPFEYRTYSKYLDKLGDYIFTKTIEGRRMQREKVN